MKNLVEIVPIDHNFCVFDKGTVTSIYTVEQLAAENQRDLEQQREINSRMQERQNAIDALSAAQTARIQKSIDALNAPQTVQASTNEEVVVQGGEVTVAAASSGAPAAP